MSQPDATSTSGSAPPKRAGLLHRLSVEKLVRASCFASVLAMLLMSWSVLDPTPFPVIISMSVGQVIGTVALACYCAAVFLAQVQRLKKP